MPPLPCSTRISMRPAVEITILRAATSAGRSPANHRPCQRRGCAAPGHAIQEARDLLAAQHDRQLAPGSDAGRSSCTAERHGRKAQGADERCRDGPGHVHRALAAKGRSPGWRTVIRANRETAHRPAAPCSHPGIARCSLVDMAIGQAGMSGFVLTFERRLYGGCASVYQRSGGVSLAICLWILIRAEASIRRRRLSCPCHQA